MAGQQLGHPDRHGRLDLGLGSHPQEIDPEGPHDLELADRVAERTVAMFRGRIVADRATGAIFRDAGLLRELGLDPPVRYALVEAVRSRLPDEAENVERLVLPRLADATGR